MERKEALAGAHHAFSLHDLKLAREPADLEHARPRLLREVQQSEPLRVFAREMDQLPRAG